MSNEAEHETSIIADAPIEADTSREATGAETVEVASADIDAVVAGEDTVGPAQPEPPEASDTPESETGDSTTETKAEEVPAPTDAEIAAGATSDVEMSAEEPQAAVPTAKEEPAGEEPAPEESVAAEPAKAEKAPEPKTPLSALEAGTEVTGRIVGIADFGAFVDIGAETDGLIHISELSDGRVNKVSDVVSIGQQVTVWIKDVDEEKERISLSMRPKPKYRLRDLKPGMVVEGTVTGVRDYGVFVDIGAETEGLVHVSEMAESFVSKPSELVAPGDEVEVRIKKVDRRRRRISLSMKGFGAPSPPPEPQQQEPLPTAMELAMRRALGELEEEIEEASQERIDVEETSRDDLGDVFARMLREYQEDTEES